MTRRLLPNQRLQQTGAAEYGTVAFVRLAGTVEGAGAWAPADFAPAAEARFVRRRVIHPPASSQHHNVVGSVKGEGRNPGRARGGLPVRAPRHPLGTLVRRAAHGIPVARVS